jgi:hypothetical protein
MFRRRVIAESRWARLLVVLLAMLLPAQALAASSCDCAGQSFEAIKPCCGGCKIGARNLTTEPGCPNCRDQAAAQPCHCGDECHCATEPGKSDQPIAPQPSTERPVVLVTSASTAVAEVSADEPADRVLTGSVHGPVLSPLDRCRRLSRFTL